METAIMGYIGTTIWNMLRPQGSNVAPCWVCYVFVVREYKRLPKKQLHTSVWVNHFQ